MSLDIGNEQCSNGLSHRIYEFIDSHSEELHLTDDRRSIKLICYAIAKGVVEELTLNAQAVIPAGIAALQTCPTSGAPTGPSTTEFTLSIR